MVTSPTSRERERERELAICRMDQNWGREEALVPVKLDRLADKVNKVLSYENSCPGPTILSHTNGTVVPCFHLLGWSSLDDPSCPVVKQDDSLSHVLKPQAHSGGHVATSMATAEGGLQSPWTEGPAASQSILASFVSPVSSERSS